MADVTDYVAGSRSPAAGLIGIAAISSAVGDVQKVVLTDQNGNTLTVLATVAQDGTDSSDAYAVQATSGLGIRGWLSTLVSLLRSGQAKVWIRDLTYADQVTTLPGVAQNATLSNVAASTTSQTLLPLNTARKGVSIFNDSTANLYVAYAGSASVTSFTVKITAGAYWEMEAPPYAGALAGVWDSAAGAARVTEKT